MLFTSKQKEKGHFLGMSFGEVQSFPGIAFLPLMKEKKNERGGCYLLFMIRISWIKPGSVTLGFARGLLLSYLVKSEC